MTVALPTVDDVLAARSRIADVVAAVEVRPGSTLHPGADLVCEYLQPTGSFKIRGATNAVLAAVERGARGVTTASTGNHARAVTHVATRAGLPVRAFVSAGVAPSRVQALRDAGADVDRAAADQSEALSRAAAAAQADGAAFVPPFDHPDVVAGQGTLGLELTGYDVVLVPVSGGGLAAGVGLALRGLDAPTRVVGVSAANAPAMARSLQAGRPMPVEEVDTVATSLMGDLGPDNRITFPLCRRVLDDLVLVGEDDLRAATAALHDLGHPVEPSAAAGTALLATAGARFAGQRVAVLLTGRADTEPTTDGGRS